MNSNYFTRSRLGHWIIQKLPIWTSFYTYYRPSGPRKHPPWQQRQQNIPQSNDLMYRKTSPFDFTTEHMAGAKMWLSDYISRHPSPIFPSSHGMTQKNYTASVPFKNSTNYPFIWYPVPINQTALPPGFHTSSKLKHKLQFKTTLDQLTLITHTHKAVQLTLVKTVHWQHIPTFTRTMT